MRVRTGRTGDVSLLHRCLHPGSLTLLEGPFNNGRLRSTAPTRIYMRLCTWRQTRPRLSWWQCTHTTSAVPVATAFVQGLPEKYRDIKLTTYKDPEFDLPKIQATIHHLYLDDLSRDKGKGKLVARRGVAMSVEAAPDSTSIICQKCGKEGHCKSGCAVPGKIYDKRNNGHARNSEKSRGKAGDTTKKWCSLHTTTSHKRRRLFQAGSVAPEGGRGVFCYYPRRSLSLFRERREAGHQL